jgi:hypothetical protein
VHALILPGWLGSLACAVPLLPDERVIGVDVVAERFDGSPGDRLGEVVAWTGGSWLATAPGAAQVWRDGAAVDAAAMFAGWWGERVLLVDAEGRVTVDGELVLSDPTSFAWAVGADGLAVALPGTVVLLQDVGAPTRSVRVDGLRALVAEPDGSGWTALACRQDACSVVDIDAEGAVGPERMSAPVDGVLGLWRTRVWVGEPSHDDGAGRACDEAGDCVEGLPGDGLGAAFGGGRVAGTFNSRIVPPRARIVSLDGEPTLALETGAELQPLALAGSGGALVIGAPYHAAEGLPAGGVWVLPP